MSNEKKSVPPLQTIIADALMNTDYPPLAFSIEKLLPQGIFILAAVAKSASPRRRLKYDFKTAYFHVTYKQ